MRTTVSKERIGIEPPLGKRLDRFPNWLRRQKPFQERVCLFEGTGNREEHVLLDGGEWAAAARKVVCGAVLEIERRTVIDEHQPPVPEEHVAVARCAVYVGHVCIEPHD